MAERTDPPAAGWPTTEELLAEIMVDPPPTPPRRLRRPQNRSGYVKRKIRLQAGRGQEPPKPYATWQRVPIATFWIGEHYFRGLPVPPDVVEMLAGFTVAEQRALIAALDHLNIKVA